MLTAISLDETPVLSSTQQSNADGKASPQLSVPQTSAPSQSLSESQSPSPNLQGLELVQQPQSGFAAPQEEED